MKKQIVILVLLVAVILTGCANNPQPGISAPVPAGTTGSTQDPEATTIPVTSPVLSPVTAISCIQPDITPAFLAAQNGTVLACWADVEGAVTHLRIVDLISDTIVASADLDGRYELFPENFTNHGFVLRDRANSRWLFLNAQLDVAGNFSSESMEGFFSHDRSQFYYLRDRVLYCADTAGGEAGPVSLSGNLRFRQISSIHPTQNVLALHVYTSPFDTVCGTAILNLDTGTFSMVQSTLYQTVFGDQLIQFLHFDEQAMQYEVIYGDENSALRIPAAQFVQSGELVAVNGADYLLGVGGTTALFRLTDVAASCTLDQYGIAGAFRGVCWIPESGLLVGSVWQGSLVKIYAVAPALLTFSEMDIAENIETPVAVDNHITNGYWGNLAGDSLPENMQALREYADRLEQAYDIRILLSDQCEELAQYCDYELVRTNAMSESEMIVRVGYFLSALDKSLSMYPDGFFCQFRDRNGDGGVYFFPVAQILSDNGAVGVCYKGANWYAIALDIRMDDLIASFCHEIWHATEHKIRSDDHTLFSEEIWNRFNPDGFQYGAGMPNAAPNRWTLFDTENEAYFIDDYARTDSKEDRARLMEYVMARPDYHGQIKASAALMAKLQLMCDAISQCFDTTNWTDTPWDGFAG